MPRNPIEFRFENCDPKMLIALLDGDHRRHQRRLWRMGLLLAALLLVQIAAICWLLVRA